MKSFNSLLLTTFILSLFIACSSGGSDSLNPEISGCMDGCAENYNSEATIEDNSCMYDILGVYTIDDFIVDGESYFNSNTFENAYVNAYYEFDISVNSGASWEFIATLSDGTIEQDYGTFTNTDTTITLVSDIDNSQSTFTITNINCNELDAEGTFDGSLISFETTYGVNLPVAGCMDDCAENYNSEATIEDNSCMYDILGVYTIDDFIVDGESYFNSNTFENAYVNAYYEFDISVNSGASWEFIATLSDGTIEQDYGTFTNTDTTITLVSDIDNSQSTFTITNINCNELDAVGTFDGSLISFETTLKTN